jgi:hypothetical protein
VLVVVSIAVGTLVEASETIVEVEVGIVIRVVVGEGFNVGGTTGTEVEHHFDRVIEILIEYACCEYLTG